MNNSEIWQSVLAELELSVSKANFITWFKNTGIINLKEGLITVCTPNTFTQAWIQKKYHQLLIKSLERITGKPIKKLDYKIDNIKNFNQNAPEAEEPPVSPEPSAALEPSISASDTIRVSCSLGSFSLNPKYTFDSFVVGKGTDLAFAAAQAVINKPGEAYNPLFIYGGVGLGKTHLIQAIGNSLRVKKPNISIMYVSAEKFSNDFIDSVRSGLAKDFQNRYRTIDLLLIDDIQFIAGKDRTQESFFHTFNELHQQNRQVVMTSDRPPKAIPALEDRLKSRFEWGMIADVAAPDFETRVAILEKKCTERNYVLSPDLLQTVAVLIQNNIRELEGALNKIMVYHQLKNIIPTKNSIKTLFSDFSNTGSSRRILTADQLIEIISQFYGISEEDILGKSREKKLSFPRQIIMYLMRESLKMSYPSIGDSLGGRDHTTAMHAHTKIANEVEADLKLKQDIEQIKQRMFINNV